jgi:nitrate reductase delta subunit
MTRTLKALSALLSYPSVALQGAAREIGAVLAAEGVLSPAVADGIAPLLAELAARDVYALEEEYVFLFDRSRSLSLNLFEHVHGESRDRGQAMVDLLETYRAGGFELGGAELPDHLPVLLEFLSTRPLAEARETLADAAHILAALAHRLKGRDSAYAAVFDALVELAAEQPDAEALDALKAEAFDDPSDLVALDAVWEETAVTFGPDPNAGCPATRDLLARMDPTPRTPAAAAH